VEPAFGLEARPEDGMLHVTWNRNSAAARSAVAGLLKIADSDIAKLIPLSRSDVTGGSIEYASRSSDVTFRLQITGADGKSSEEMIRVLGNEPSNRETRPVRYQPFVRSRTAPSPKIAAKPTALEAPPAEYRQPAATPTRIASAPPTDPARFTSQQAIPTARPVSIAQPVSSPQPVPSALPSAKAGPGAADANPTPATPGERSPALPQAPPILPPEPDSATSKPLSASVVTLPPQPLHSVKPLYTHPPTIPNTGTRPVRPSTPVTVAIVVSVDEKGKVLSAQRPSDSPSKDAFLSKQALDAARQWSFKPATRGGQPVRAEFRINFVFSYNQ
jgi:periplasmic protein TonB